MAAKRVTVLLKDKDQQAVRAIQTRFRLHSRSDAIRFALRVLTLPAGSQEARSKLQLPALLTLSQGSAAGEDSAPFPTQQVFPGSGLAEHRPGSRRDSTGDPARRELTTEPVGHAARRATRTRVLVARPASRRKSSFPPTVGRKLS
jgi:Arc/MetJ-type ribon-helix-helix transcriptional regulator